MNKITKYNTKKIVMLAILTAIVIALQLLASFIRFGPFSIQLVMIPIVIGAALLGKAAGAWLGFAFSMVVLLQPDTAVFWMINPIGTLITVLTKGTIAGLTGAIVYQAFLQVNRTVAALAAAIVCPVINTAIFVVGSYLFFLNTLLEWCIDAGFASVTAFIFLAMIGTNFLIELGLNILLCPAIVRLIQHGQKTA